MQTTHFILLIPEIHEPLRPKPTSKLTEGAEQASQTDRQLPADA